MKTRTIRELGGEVWAEISMRMRDGELESKDFPIEALHEFIDLMTGVLARYKGATIVDDDDLPVAPLEPHRHFPNS